LKACPVSSRGQGLLEDIILYEGKILAGRERSVSCLRKKVPPRFREYAGECGSALEFVVSKKVSVPWQRPGSGLIFKRRPANGNSLR
jgi:hypothetical protein